MTQEAAVPGPSSARTRRARGSDPEFSKQYGLFAVDVPPSVRFRDVQSLLESMQGSLDIGFEAPIMYDD